MNTSSKSSNISTSITPKAIFTSIEIIPEEKRNPSNAKTKLILKDLKRREKIGKQALKISDSEMEILYSEFSSSLTKTSTDQTKQLEDMYNRSKQITDYFAELRQRNLKDIQDSIKRINVLNLEIKHIENNGDSFHTNIMVDDCGSSTAHGRRASQITKSIMELSESIIPFSNNNVDSIKKINKVNILSTPSKNQKEIVTNEISTPIISNNSEINDINKNEDNNDNSNSNSNDDDSVDKLTLDDLTITSESTKTDRVLFEDNNDNSNNNINIEEKKINKHEISTDYRRIYSEQYKRHYYIDQKTSETQWNKPSNGIISCLDDCDVVFYMNAKTKKTSWVISEIL